MSDHIPSAVLSRAAPPSTIDRGACPGFPSAIRVRLAVALVSAATIALELALIRVLSLRFWHHFAFMAVSMALLGFGASGSVLAVLRERVVQAPAAWLVAAAATFAVSVPATAIVAPLVPVDVQFLPWDIVGQSWRVLALELVMCLPFIFGGGFVGIALLDEPSRLSGHYACDLAGSGAGAAGAVALLWHVTAPGLTMAAAVAGLAAAVCLLDRTSQKQAVVAGGAALLLGLLWAVMPGAPTISQYKALPQLLRLPGIECVATRNSPLGRLDVLAGNAVHHAPGLSLAYAARLPPHRLIITDGDAVSPVYHVRQPAEWAFMDHTTRALVQACLLSAALIVAPLLLRGRAGTPSGWRHAVAAYFLLIGLGFMLLEIALLQQFILYLAHPINAASVTIAAFLLWAGLGSALSRRWPWPRTAVVPAAAGAVAVGAGASLIGLRPWLALTQGAPLPMRVAIAVLTIAPLGVCMGHLFPLGLTAVAERAEPLRPWALALNGCASVVAALAAPLLAMAWGFSAVTATAGACYLAAAIVGARCLGNFRTIVGNTR